jgi:hypothetical protein
MSTIAGFTLEATAETAAEFEVPDDPDDPDEPNGSCACPLSPFPAGDVAEAWLTSVVGALPQAKWPRPTPMKAAAAPTATAAAMPFRLEDDLAGVGPWNGGGT